MTAQVVLLRAVRSLAPHWALVEISQDGLFQQPASGTRSVGVTIVVNTGGLGRREGCSCSISRASGEVVASRGCQPTENGGSRTREAAQAATLQTAPQRRRLRG